MTPGPPRAPGSTLVVVESPAKGRTMQRWLGAGYKVMATMGHLLDLPEHVLGVDVERGFSPTYQVPRGKNRLLSDLKRAARAADRVLLATDPDREGEAIAWLLAEELGAPGGSRRVRRVLLRELTPAALHSALAQPCDLDQRRFEAQQARRILDRLVGWKVSPLLWARVRRGLSAGRVQSAAVRLVVERERERQAFAPQERWGVEVGLAATRGSPLRARLVELAGQPVHLAGRAEAEGAARSLEGAAFAVLEVTRRLHSAPAPPPFTTAALQQVAAAALGFSPRRTMALAQRLYEGVDLGEAGAVGLVSYPRTASEGVGPATEAWGRAWAETAFGREHAGEPARVTGTNGDWPGGHEAIRPTSAEWPPARVLPLLRRARERDLGRLYRLIWERFVASLMAPALHEEVTVRLAASLAGAAPRAVFQAAGASVARPGWLVAHGGGPPSSEAGGAAGTGRARLPPLLPGQALRLVALAAGREVTAPPPRFTEGTLVQALEAGGLGRPSTFAAVVDAVQARGYVERTGRQLAPTALGVRVTDTLAEVFPGEVGLAFTAGLEAALDGIEEGRADWRAVVAGFHGQLQEALARGASAGGSGAGRSLDTPGGLLVGNSAVYSPTRPHTVRAFPTRVVERQR